MADVGLVAAAALGAIAVWIARAAVRRAELAGRQAFRLTFRRGVTADELEAFLRSLGGLLPPWWRRVLGTPSVLIETHATAGGIEHRLVTPQAFGSYVLSQLRATIPGTRVAELDRIEPIRPSLAAELRLSASEAQLRVDAPEASVAGVLATLQPLRSGEAVVVQWLLGPLPAARLRSVEAFLGRARRPADPWARDVPPELLRAARQKALSPQLGGVLRLGVRATSAARDRQLLRRMLGSFHAGTAPGVSFRRRWLPSGWVAGRLAAGVPPSGAWPCVLSTDEAAAFVGIPLGEPQLPGLRLGAAPQLAPVPEIPSGGRVLGRSTFPGLERLLALSAADSLRHLHVIGPTGVGKSSLLTSLAVQDMNAGHGVVVIDPKGDLVSDVLGRVPAKRLRDVIVLDPTDAARPVGFNLLSGGVEAPELVTDGVVSIFRNLYAAFWGPRTDDILRAAVLTLAAEPGMTLCEVPLLLTDGRFRQRLLGRLDDPVGLEPFWSWYAELSPGERSQAIGPVLNKLRSFLLRRRLRRVIGQSESGFSMEAVLRERKVLLISLRKGVLGEDAAALLGSALLARLWQAVQGRAAMAPDERHPVFCYVDEFQDYLRLPTSLADVLAQARGYGLGLTLAHQHLGQLPLEVRHAVLANARSRLVFQTAAADARLLAREFAPYVVAEDLQALGPFEAVLAAAAGNTVCPPATLTTLPPGPTSDHGEAARALSRQTYGRDAEAIDAELTTRLTGSLAGSPVGRRRRP